MCLNQSDLNLYGERPSDDIFALVTCKFCGMSLKQPALVSHIERRHQIEMNSRLSEVSHDAKRRKVEDNLAISEICMQTQQFFLFGDAAMDVDESDEGKITMKLKKFEGRWAVIRC